MTFELRRNLLVFGLTVLIMGATTVFVFVFFEDKVDEKKLVQGTIAGWVLVGALLLTVLTIITITNAMLRKKQKKLLLSAKDMGLKTAYQLAEVDSFEIDSLTRQIEQLRLPIRTDRTRYQCFSWGHIEDYRILLFQTPHGSEALDETKSKVPTLASSGDDRWMTVVNIKKAGLTLPYLHLSSDIDYPEPNNRDAVRILSSTFPELAEVQFKVYREKSTLPEMALPSRLMDFIYHDSFMSDYCDSLLITIQEDSISLCRREMLDGDDLKDFVRTGKEILSRAERAPS